MKNQFLRPVVVLVSICLVISAALALTNSLTAPIIEAAAQDAATEAQREMLPDASGFTLIESADLPDGVTEMYRADGGAGYVATVSAKGYAGDIDIICGIDGEGNIVKTKTLSHSETSGVGSKITEPEFMEQFVGKGEGLDGVEAISGATVSSEAYIGAIRSALAAYKTVEGSETN